MSDVSDGLRQENDKPRVTCVYPGVVESELANTITDASAAKAMCSGQAVMHSLRIAQPSAQLGRKVSASNGADGCHSHHHAVSLRAIREGFQH